MKLICLNRRECGHIEYNQTKETDNICPACFHAALLFSDDYEPIFLQNDEKYLDALIAAIHNLLNNIIMEDEKNDKT